MIEELLRDEPGFDEARAAICETMEKIRNETDEERVEREERYKKYVEVQGLFDAIEGGDTVLISARWLLEQERGYVLPKRGELPEEALVSANELRRSYEGRYEQFDYFPIIAVSHCWRTQAHPDPEGVTTRVLQEQLEQVWKWLTDWHEFSDVGIFFDWCSLWQSPRTPEQLKSFKRALPAINLWYAHSDTFVWLVTDALVPHADGRTLGYAQKGWTMFEAALARKIKRNSGFQIEELGDGLGINDKTPMPPNEPLAFFKRHRYGNQFYTNGADQDTIVAPLYKRATEDILGGVKLLDYTRENWDDVHAARLRLVLPLCVSLRKLDVRCVGLTARGLRAILEPVVDDNALSKLESLYIADNKELGNDGARALGAALKNQRALENLLELNVGRCNLTATGLRAILDPIVDEYALSKLEVLYIQGNKELGDDGACALGAALKKQGALENLRRLDVSYCNLTATGLRAILEPVVDDNALSKLESLYIQNNGELGDEGACALGAALKRQGALANLQVLDVRHCNVTATGLRAILEPVVDDNALSKLDCLNISHNGELGDEGACALGEVVKKQGALENLQELLVSECNLTATGLRAILEPIVNDDRALPKLRELSLMRNSGHDDERVRALVAAFKQDELRKGALILC